MRSVYCLVLVCLLTDCAADSTSSPRECEVPLFSSTNGDIPPCHWLVTTYGCETFADMSIADENGDGLPDEFVAFCRDEHDGDSLTQDVQIPPATWDAPREFCYTCD